MIETMEQEDLNSVTANITAKVPYPIRLKIQEKAMYYKMTLNAYMNVMIGQMVQNEDLMNPDKVKEMSAAIGQLQTVKSELEKVNSELDQEREGHENAVKAWKAAMEAIGELTQEKNDLEGRLKAAEGDKDHLTRHYEGKRRTLSQSAQKSIKEANDKAEKAEAKAKELEQRLAKANKKLKDENITEGPFLGPQKLVQF